MSVSVPYNFRGSSSILPTFINRTEANFRSEDTSKTETPVEGVKVNFEVTEYDLDTLVSKLVEFERTHNLSSIEMFSRYVRGELNEELDEWIDLFILYLGTSEIRQFSCL
jgi:hypothetical protein